MAYGNFILDKGYDSASALTKFRAVKLHANRETVTAVTGGTDQFFGVTQFDITAGELAKGKGASVRLDGITEWEVSAAVTRGQEVSMAADGRCKPAATGERIWGIAIEGADAAGKRASVQIEKAGRVMP